MAGLDLSVDALAFLRLSVPAVWLGRVEAELQSVALQLREFILDYWPRDTGRSVRSWDVYADGTRLVVFNPVDYAEWVHPSGETEGEAGRRVEQERNRLLLQARPGLAALASTAAPQAPKTQRAQPASPFNIQRGLRAAYEARPARLRERDRGQLRLRVR